MTAFSLPSGSEMVCKPISGARKLSLNVGGGPVQLGLVLSEPRFTTLQT